MNIDISEYFDTVADPVWIEAAKKSLKFESDEKLEKFLTIQSIEGISYKSVLSQNENLIKLDTFPKNRLLARYSNDLSDLELNSGVNFCLSENKESKNGIYLLSQIQYSDLPSEINLDLLGILDQFDFDLVKTKLWLKKLTQEVKVFPFIKLSRVHNAGASIVQELGAMISLVEFCHESNLCESLFIEFATDSMYFNNIAKLRAARFILESLTEQWHKFNFEILASTSIREFTFFDPWMNMLRLTSSCANAIIGGANTVVLSGYDTEVSKLIKDYNSSDLSLRHSRNVFHILNEESFLSQVEDPSAGSYLIEKLTTLYIEAGFTNYKAYKEQGGILKNITKFSLEVEKVAMERKVAINKNKVIISGINSFTQVNETLKENFKLDQEIVGVAIKSESIYFPIRRTAEEYENLRLDLKNKNLEINLFAFGKEEKLSARVMFCRDFFEVLGFEVKTSFLKSEDDIIKNDNGVNIICALDEDYEQIKNWDLQGRFTYIAGKKVNREGAINIYQGVDKFKLLSDLRNEVLA